MKVYKNRNAMQNIIETYDKLLGMWGVNVEEKDILTTYGTTHVILCGNENNPPLVLFHGVGDNSALMWLYNAEFLSRHFRIYAVDTIGGPGKSQPNENYNKTFRDDKWLDEVFAGLSLDKVYVAGVSNGAYLTQYCGLHRPDHVIKMVCMAGSVPVGNFGSIGTMMKVFMPEALFPSKNNAAKLLKKLSGKNSHVFTDNSMVLEHYCYLLKGFNNMAMAYHNIEHFNDAEIKLIREKTLYLVGEDDPFAQLGGKSALLQYEMNTHFYPNVGHGINHEIADVINQQLVDYLLS